jgi:hypothetical protein
MIPFYWPNQQTQKLLKYQKNGIAPGTYWKEGGDDDGIGKGENRGKTRGKFVKIQSQKGLLWLRKNSAFF